MLLFFDTSALIKRYVEEPGSRKIQALLSSPTLQGSFLVSRQVEGEILATLNKKYRQGLTRRHFRSAKTLFRLQYPSLFAIVPMNDEVWDDSVRILDLYRDISISAPDAQHLAALRYAQSALQPDDPIIMVTADGPLAFLCGRLGVPTFNPETHDLAALGP